jgi:uncharacterized membrane protein
MARRNLVNVPRNVLQFLAVSTLATAAAASPPQTSQAAKKPPTATPAAVPAPNAPQSTHFPILLLAFGSGPSWDVRIGPKGPELLQRQGYPPILLDPGEISREGTSDIWNYRAKDTATNADVAVRLTRESCSDPSSATKYTFRAVVSHSQIGTLQGCARIAAELFPRMPNQFAQADDDDTDKKQPVLPPITNSKLPVAVAFVNPAGKIIVSRNGIKRIAAPSGSQLALSHDGKRLLYTREDPKSNPPDTIVLYDFETGRSRDLVHGVVGQPFWSPDDARIAYVSTADQKSQVWTTAPDSPERAAPFSAQNIVSLQGWGDLHTVLASDAQNVYWLSEDKPAQTVALREIYGDMFQVKPSDTLRLNPANSDLLLVSAAFVSPATGAALDATGTAYGLFLYELRSRRRAILSPPDQLAKSGEWSRDGVQVFYTRHSGPASAIARIFWDGSGPRSYVQGSDLVIGP